MANGKGGRHAIEVSKVQRHGISDAAGNGERDRGSMPDVRSRRAVLRNGDAEQPDGTAGASGIDPAFDRGPPAGPGSSALFALIRKATADKVLDGLKRSPARARSLKRRSALW